MAAGVMRANVHSHLPHPCNIGEFFFHYAPQQCPAEIRSPSRDLAAAQRCFVRSGFHGASMQDICAEAGMSPGNLYRYFPSKEALDRRHCRARPRRGRTGVRQRRPLARLLCRARGHGPTSFRGAVGVSRWALCTEIMSESRATPRSRASPRPSMPTSGSG